MITDKNVLLSLAESLTAYLDWLREQEKLEERRAFLRYKKLHSMNLSMANFAKMMERLEDEYEAKQWMMLGAYLHQTDLNLNLFTLTGHEIDTDSFYPKLIAVDGIPENTAYLVNGVALDDAKNGDVVRIQWTITQSSDEIREMKERKKRKRCLAEGHLLFTKK